MPRPLILREAARPRTLIVIRLGSSTLSDERLADDCASLHKQSGVFGFSVLEVPDDSYEQLARLRPFVTSRRLILVAEGNELVAAGFPLLLTMDHPHWTVVVAEPTPTQFALVRSHFHGPVDNPVWAGRGRSVP